MKKVIVTGSSRGIGRSIVIALAKAGYDPVIHCLARRAEADAVAEEVRALGGSGHVLQFDVADREVATQVLGQFVAENGAPYGVVLNAGYNSDMSFAAMEDSDWDRVLNVNLDGFYHVLKPLVTPMVLEHVKGRIVVISSVVALEGTRGQVNYAAAKAGLVGAAKSLAIELAPRGITVNCLAPGIIETEMSVGAFEADILKQIPMKRMGKPEEIAGVVRFLMSEDASYITRQVIRIDGGFLGRNN